METPDRVCGHPAGPHGSPGDTKHRPKTAPRPRAMPRVTVSHYRRAVVARALPLDSARIVMWNIGAKNAHGGVI